ncbi:MAG: flagellar filament capping protein FliD, partial [candidate division Zixibacteria bacterium]|nr:flagellar filament capping protein FliD [candidate division Zixibacteria bacterium]
ARIAFGSSGGSGSPITVTSDSNQFTDVIAGVSLVVRKETDPGETISITTGTDVTAIQSQIQAVVKAYNDVMDFVDSQNDFDADSQQIGVLFGDQTVQLMQSSLRSGMGARIDGLNSKYNQLYSVGIRTGADGKLSIKDSSRLKTALEDSLDDVVKLFTNAGTTDATFIEFQSSTAATKVGADLDVDITKAATVGRFQGSGIADPGATPLTLNTSNNRLKFSVDGIHSDEIILSEKTYMSADELVREIQDKIDADAKIGSRGVTAEWVSTGTGTGFLNIKSSTYGSSSAVHTITSIGSSAFATLGLATGVSHDGQDVEGTINGEAATGSGQILTGSEGNATTEGLKLRITLTESQILGGVEGKVTLTKGIAARVDDLLDSLTAAGDGMIARRISSYENQVTNLKEQIEAFDKRLEKRREDLVKQFWEMEVTLGELSATNSALESQLAQINSNWVLGRTNK